MAATPHRSKLDYASVVAVALTAAAASYATVTPARAATPAYYEVQLAAPLATARSEIQNGVVWKCAGAECRAAQGNSRPAVVCARLARKVGPLASFAANGEALDAAALAKCNGEEAAPLARR